MSSWVDHVMWWHVYPLGFTGAPVRPEAGEGASADAPAHRLGRIESWLDHVVDLGLNGLALGPVFASSTHGYDTTDHFRIDPRLGDEADFDRLVAAAHERGIRVLLDGVFNHVGRAHPAFAALEESGPSAATAALFRVDWQGWQPGDPVRADVFEGHDQLVALDHSSPAVADLVVEVMTYWLGRGADGWRLDAAYAVPPAFWAQVLPRVRDVHPDAWFTGEVIHGDALAIVAESGLDSLTQYELWQGLWHGIADANLFELKHAVERGNELLEGFVPTTFVGNHDVSRIASAIPDARHLPHALALLFTLAGTPMVYAGDEYGLRAVKEERLGGDDAVRPEFPDSPPSVESLPSSLPGAGPDARELLALHGELIALRRRHAWLHSARSDVLHVTNTALVVRTATGSGAVVTALNIGDEAVAVPAGGASAVLAGSASLAAGRASLPPHGWAVLGD
ncbi:alpha-amylase family glycosyl hydrolase [Herbiconiux flava]|uniref:Glycosidase n=1 Tax=Herbiconiux flava TaxID=881268 RepID=A0A852SME9_9MICO|nr:alpha-amylase family glycosyl hydrolase [Herbiconiux flava]NYD69977.1 glycosidase [Herbiconiux flava]